MAEDDELLGSFIGAQLVVRVRAERIFPNCPRYIHRIAAAEPLTRGSPAGVSRAAIGEDSHGDLWFCGRPMPDIAPPRDWAFNLWQTQTALRVTKGWPAGGMIGGQVP